MLLFYLCFLYILYIISKRHYDVSGTTITIKKLDNPLDVKSLEDMGIVPVFNNDEYALLEPLEELLNINDDCKFYIELDNRDRISALSNWDSYLEYMGPRNELREKDENHQYSPDKYRLSNTPQKQLEYGKIVGLDDLKVVKYDKHKINTLDTTPVEVGFLNDILKQVTPSLKKFYKDGLPDSFVMNLLEITAKDLAGLWGISGIFHQDIAEDALTIRRPYTRSTAKHRTRDIRMIILDPESIGDLTEFAKVIGGRVPPSHKRLDDIIDGKEKAGIYSTEFPVDVIKLDKAGKTIIGILFDNQELFHSVPRTSLSLIEFLMKNSGSRKIYQIGFSDGFFGAMTAASAKGKKKKKKKKTKNKKSKKSKSKKKEKKYKIEFE